VALQLAPVTSRYPTSTRAAGRFKPVTTTARLEMAA